MSTEQFLDTQFYKRHEGDKIWWVRLPNEKGRILFSFDKKEVFNIYGEDFWQKLTKEQRELFAKENPEWAKFKGLI